MTRVTLRMDLPSSVDLTSKAARLRFIAPDERQPKRLATRAEGRIFACMGITFAGGIHVVAATKGGQTEFWAAATSREKAVEEVRKLLTSEWTVVLTDRRLTPEKVVELKMRPNSVRKLRRAR